VDASSAGIPGLDIARGHRGPVSQRVEHVGGRLTYVRIIVDDEDPERRR
jgi:hypothetical protein